MPAGGGPCTYLSWTHGVDGNAPLPVGAGGDACDRPIWVGVVIRLDMRLTSPLSALVSRPSRDLGERKLRHRLVPVHAGNLEFSPVEQVKA